MENLELCYRLLFLYKFSLRETNFTKQLERFMLISFTYKTYTLSVQEKGRQQGIEYNSELLLQIHSKILQIDDTGISFSSQSELNLFYSLLANPILENFQFTKLACQSAFSPFPSKEPRADGSGPRNLLSQNCREQGMVELGLFPSETNDDGMISICEVRFLIAFLLFSLCPRSHWPLL